MTGTQTVSETVLPELRLLRRGKVRDVYVVDDSHLLIVATDRISAFDCILPTQISRKGEVLTALSAFWFHHLASITKNHLVTTNVDEMPEEVRAHSAVIARRSMFVRATEVVPVECVVRGYLAGSGWKDYQRTGEVCGHRLRPDLLESDRLDEPIFTPATKAESGHDENISEAVMAQVVGAELAGKLRQLSLALYSEAAEYARTRGIIIADTKFEFGVDKEGGILLIDEVLTPDSSRFWPAADYAPGRPQASFDKQYVRDYLETLDWDKTPPAPALPPNVAEATTARYVEAYRLLTGREL